MQWLRLILLLLLLASNARGHAQSGFCAQAGALLDQSNAHWGLSVATLDGGSVCAIHEAQLFRPASNAKLLTIAAALDVLGPEKTFETRVAGDFDPATGIVRGDLTLIGGGDANLDSGDLPYLPQAQAAKPPQPFAFHDLDDLAAQLAAKGVKTVAGDIVGDDHAFPHEPYGSSWELDDLVWGYGAPVSALSIADNQLKLTLTPGLNHQNAGVAIDDHGVSYYTAVSDVQTVAGTTPAQIQIERLPGSRKLRVFGTIGENARADNEEIAVDDPAEYAALAFRQALAAHGIAVVGKARASHLEEYDGAGFTKQLLKPNGAEESFYAHPGDLGSALSCGGYVYPPTLATHTSAPLGQDAIFTAKVSQNLHAELLLHALGRRMGCQTGSTISGARMVRAFTLHVGISADDFLLYDGSGLSSHDLVAPRALTQLLVFAAKQAWFPTFRAALPVGGTDGSLASRFTGVLKGRVFAKTGTLGESRALSGYLTAASGKTLAFSILVDNHRPDSHEDRLLMDQMVELIAAAN